MKRNGFTLLELLIGISLISIVMIFLFRLLNDIQHEALSNTYIVANQTNRNEMINVLIGLPKCGPKTARKLLDLFGTPGKVFKATDEDLNKVPRLTTTTINAIRRMR